MHTPLLVVFVTFFIVTNVQSVHEELIESLMDCYLQSCLHVDDIMEAVSAINQGYGLDSVKNVHLDNQQSMETMDFLERAILTWLNQISYAHQKFSNPNKQSSIYTYWRDICDGVAIVKAIVSYRPELVKLHKEIVETSYLDTDERLQNWRAIIKYCDEYLHIGASFSPHALADLRLPTLRSNLLVFLCDLFSALVYDEDEEVVQSPEEEIEEDPNMASIQSRSTIRSDYSVTDPFAKTLKSANKIRESFQLMRQSMADFNPVKTPEKESVKFETMPSDSDEEPEEIPERIPEQTRPCTPPMHHGFFKQGTPHSRPSTGGSENKEQDGNAFSKERSLLDQSDEEEEPEQELHFEDFPQPMANSSPTQVVVNIDYKKFQDVVEQNELYKEEIEKSQAENVQLKESIEQKEKENVQLRQSVEKEKAKVVQLVEEMQKKESENIQLKEIIKKKETEFDKEMQAMRQEFEMERERIEEEAVKHYVDKNQPQPVKTQQAPPMIKKVIPPPQPIQQAPPLIFEPPPVNDAPQQYIHIIQPSQPPIQHGQHVVYPQVIQQEIRPQLEEEEEEEYEEEQEKLSREEDLKAKLVFSIGPDDLDSTAEMKRDREVRAQKLEKLRQQKQLEEEERKKAVAPKPSKFTARSNKLLIKNALSFVCLQGRVNEVKKRQALEVLKLHKGEHFVVQLLDDKNSTFKGLYCYENNELNKIFGDGPPIIPFDTVDMFLRYESASKQFNPLPTKEFLLTTDAVVVLPHNAKKIQKKSQMR